MAAMTIQEIAKSGLNYTLAAVATGDTIKQSTDRRTFLLVRNAGVGSINVTIPAQRTTGREDGAGTFTIADLVVAVTNGQDRMIGPFPEAYVNASGNVTVNYSGTTSVTAAAIHIPNA